MTVDVTVTLDDGVLDADTVADWDESLESVGDGETLGDLDPDEL